MIETIGLVALVGVFAVAYLWGMFSEFAPALFLITLGVSGMPSLGGSLTHAGYVVLFWAGVYGLALAGFLLVERWAEQ